MIWGGVGVGVRLGNASGLTGLSADCEYEAVASISMANEIDNVRVIKARYMSTSEGLVIEKNLANFKKAGSWSVRLAAGSGNSAFTCEVRERYRNWETLSRVIFECAPTIAKGALHRTYAEQVSAANKLRIRSHAAACHPSAEANCRVDKEQSG